jgi:hypothetical protein
MLSLLILAVIPKRKWWWLLFAIVLAVNFGIRTYYIQNSYVLKRELEETKELVQPPTLALSVAQVVAAAKNPTVLLQFTPSKNQPLGALSFAITLLGPDSAKIISVDRRNLTTGDSKTMSPDARSATISFTPLGAQSPVLVLEVSEPCKIRIEGNHIPEPVEFELKWTMPNN